MRSVLPLLCPHCTDGVLILEKYFSDERIECDQCESVFSSFRLVHPGWITYREDRLLFHKSPYILALVKQGWRFSLVPVVFPNGSLSYFSIEVFHVSDKYTPAQFREQRDHEYRYSKGVGGRSYAVVHGRTIDDVIDGVLNHLGVKRESFPIE